MNRSSRSRSWDCQRTTWWAIATRSRASGSPCRRQVIVVQGTTMTCRLHGEPDALLRVAMAHHVVRWQSQDRDLEDLFMEFYRDEVPGAVAPVAAATAVAPAAMVPVRRLIARPPRRPARCTTSVAA